MSLLEMMDIEEASMRAWPALEMETQEFGVLRYANGYTKRANSLWVHVGQKIAASEMLGQCDSFYRARKLPTIIRLVAGLHDDDQGVASLDSYLAEQGLLVSDLSMVMTLEMSQWNPCIRSVSALEYKLLADWFIDFQKLSGLSSEDCLSCKEILNRVDSERLFACLYANDRLVSCVALALHQQMAGVFNLTTAPEFRRHGNARVLMNLLLNRAQADEIKKIYLQVAENNVRAISLYSSLGFKPLYRYWYRVREDHIT